ncbi:MULTISPECIES: hypothetical protein [unclassified Microbacterium]|uniref:hypothetical protein n=1 Tax=unclassified Microbacterium TaxID=2609290 RepID=UPI00214C1E41|nr:MULTISPECIES: hypothetical protein [unclassified Microbacterium]MCR2784140.1 hypothetical protein [Microbacterium sp. zg.B96]WIM15024.1 hypothetical protein QNO11_10735 [Microbacterium sp. zg-B96]
MPLWGLSLDREVAKSFGNAFLFEVVGPFPAIPAWAESGIKGDERELIAGGRYSIARIEEANGGAPVELYFVEVVPLAM